MNNLTDEQLVATIEKADKLYDKHFTVSGKYKEYHFIVRMLLVQKGLIELEDYNREFIDDRCIAIGSKKADEEAMYYDLKDVEQHWEG